MAEKEYIEREAFLEEKRKLYCENCERRYGLKKGKSVVCYEIGDAPCRSCGIGDVLDDVEGFPAAEVHKIAHGHWRERNFSENCTGFECSVCHTTWDANTSFCPFCGTKMDGEA